MHFVTAASLGRAQWGEEPVEAQGILQLTIMGPICCRFCFWYLLALPYSFAIFLVQARYRVVILHLRCGIRGSLGTCHTSCQSYGAYSVSLSTLVARTYRLRLKDSNDFHLRFHRRRQADCSLDWFFLLLLLPFVTGYESLARSPFLSIEMILFHNPGERDPSKDLFQGPLSCIDALHGNGVFGFVWVDYI